MMMGWLLGIPILIIVAVSAVKVAYLFGTLNSDERDDMMQKVKEVVGLLLGHTKRLLFQLLEKSKDLFSMICRWLDNKYRVIRLKLKRQKRIVIGNFEPRNESEAKHL